jgi:signal transduction histidine kinase
VIGRPPLRRVRRWWPQKIRTRLTLLYAALFLAAGSALLGLTYGLVASSLPGTASGSKDPAMQAAKFRALCKQPLPKDAQQAASVKQQCQAAYLAGSASQRDQALHNLLLFSLLGLGGMTVASGGLGWVVSGRVLRPVRTITETARRASEEHLGERLGLTGARDELKELADTFDEMLERLDQAFASQRRFVANASHELRTPLTLMRTAIDVTLAKPARTAGQLEAMAVRVRRSIDRAESMIDALLVLALSDQGPACRELVDLATAAEDALDVAAPSIADRRLRVEACLEPAQTAGDPRLLERMIWNLVDNAVRHNVEDGWIQVRTGTGAGTAFLQVANSGSYVPSELVPGLFEPFRRMEGRAGSHSGVGLGLSIAHSVIAAHGATVVARSRPEGGLEVSVTLNRRDEDSPSPG